MHTRRRKIYGVGDEDVVEGEHHRADGKDGQDELRALGGVGEGYAEEPEEDHAWDQGHLAAVFIGDIAHDGMGDDSDGL